MLKNSVFELVQQFYHATEVAQRLRWSALADEIKTIVSDKVNYRGTQSQTCVVDGDFAKSGEVVFGRRR